MLWEPTDHVYRISWYNSLDELEELFVIHCFLEFFEAVGRRCKTPGHLDFQFQGQVYLSCVSKEDGTVVLPAVSWLSK